MSCSIEIVNPTDRAFTSSRFVLWFGAYGSTRLMVWADDLSDAFDEAIDWIAEHSPGMLADDSVCEAFDDARAAGLPDEAARELAETDMSQGGNCGNYVPSWEWGCLAENPTRADVLALQGREVAL